MNSWISKLSLNQRLSIPIMSFILLVFLGFQFISYQSYLAIERDNLLSRTKALANGVGMNLTARCCLMMPIPRKRSCLP